MSFALQVPQVPVLHSYGRSMPWRSPECSMDSLSLPSKLHVRLRALTWISMGSPGIAFSSERDVIADTEHAGIELHRALDEARSVRPELQPVDVLADREELGRAAIDRRLVDLQRGDRGRLVAIHVHGVDRGMARDRRMVAVVPRQVGEE